MIADDGTFDSWNANRNTGSINKGDYVVMFQTSKNSSAPDVVVYVKRDSTQKMMTTHTFGFSNDYYNEHHQIILSDGSLVPQPITYSFKNADTGSNGQKITLKPIAIDSSTNFVTAIGSAVKADDGLTVKVELVGKKTDAAKIRISLDTNDSKDLIRSIALSGKDSGTKFTLDPATEGKGKVTAVVHSEASLDVDTEHSQTLTFSIYNPSKTDFSNLELTAAVPSLPVTSSSTLDSTGKDVGETGVKIKVTPTLNLEVAKDDTVSVPLIFDETGKQANHEGWYTVTIAAGSGISAATSAEFEIDNTGVVKGEKPAMLTFKATDNVTNLDLTVTKRTDTATFKEERVILNDNKGGSYDLHPEFEDSSSYSGWYSGDSQLYCDHCKSCSTLHTDSQEG